MFGAIESIHYSFIHSAFVTTFVKGATFPDSPSLQSCTQSSRKTFSASSIQRIHNNTSFFQVQKQAKYDIWWCNGRTWSSIWATER